MPELPEVETICQGLQPLVGKTFQHVIIRRPKLRWAIPKHLSKTLPGQTIQSIERRAKYLLVKTNQGCLIIHLGMSGVLRLHQTLPTLQKHDHADFSVEDLHMRYNDPRRFGAILWTDNNPLEHSLLKHLGPEPLDKAFNANYLSKAAHKRNISVKTFIMDSKVVVGVGNIYAAEVLFLSRIHPERKANTLTQTEIKSLCSNIKKTLKKAIKAGGTTIKDFQSHQGKPGYFSQQLLVYGREKQPCVECQATLEKLTVGQRTTVYCPSCQLITLTKGARSPSTA